jgi:hypothetical protein
MPRSPASRGIRILGDGSGLIDERGNRWDRVRGSGYFLTTDELEEQGTPRHFLVTGSYGTPVVEVSAHEYADRLASATEDRQQAFRRGGDVVVLLDESDC